MRRGIALAATAVTMLVTAGPAHAGGANSFDTKQHIYAPATTARIHSRVSAYSHAHLRELRRHGGTLYLVAGDMTRIQPEDVPRLGDRVVRVGRVSLERVVDQGLGVISGSAHFPTQIAPGSYALVVCARSCTDGLGDLYPAGITMVRNHLRMQIERLRSDLAVEMWRARNALERRFRARARSSEAEIDMAVAHTNRLLEENDAATRALVMLANRLQDERAANRWQWIALGSVAALATVALAAAFRRRPASVAELDEPSLDRELERILAGR